MNTTAIVISVAVASLVAIFFGKLFSKKQFAHGRIVFELDDVVRTIPSCVNVELARELLVMIGKSYRIAPGLLRAEDSFAELAKLDSWSLGHGQEQVEEWLRAKNITIQANEVKTVGELLARVGQISAA